MIRLWRRWFGGFVAELRKHFRFAGTRLLERIPTGTTPTRAGAPLAGRAQELLDLEERMFAEIAADSGRATGTTELPR
ncbi:LysR family transcriptional regulator [Nonomuraea jiangxiensis]|uniref:Uncharacterized protein n=1 Tax=Nonomuraea jiangxiensis TaxID=633440 RepID=A0A1G9Q4Y6_9ACTN|nr:LysR family transcriptional regulator [Nonomuraea jiangxiensis]SDM06102.1 hypothetical protein SAMN05421869_13554 [Nonomuraea jiangxiensis]